MYALAGLAIAVLEARPWSAPTSHSPAPVDHSGTFPAVFRARAELAKRCQRHATPIRSCSQESDGQKDGPWQLEDDTSRGCGGLCPLLWRDANNHDKRQILALFSHRITWQTP